MSGLTRGALPRSMIFTVALLILFLSVDTQPTVGGPSDGSREVIVTWRTDTSAPEREVASLSAGGQLVQHFRFGPDSLVWMPNNAAEERLMRNPLVTSVVPNRQFFADEGLPGFWPDTKPTCNECGGGGGSSTQRVPRGVGRIGASPGTVSFTGSGVGVAVMDSGINGQHGDLIRTNGTRVVSLNCFKDASVTSCDSDVSSLPGGHGTKVAGVIAAVNNTVDLVGVAPSATIYNVNVFRTNPACPGTFCATSADLINGLEWIMTNHNIVSPSIQVMNISLGRSGTIDDDPALRQRFQALEALDIVITASAGNNPEVEATAHVPAAYPEVMAIASTTTVLGSDDESICDVFPHVPADTASWFTTDGAFNSITMVGVTVSAPGADQEDIVRIPGHCALLSIGLELLSREGDVTRGSGTSYSSPHVAGVVALMKEQASTLGTTVDLQSARSKIRTTSTRRLDAPLDSTHENYTFDGEREGIVWAPGALN